MLELFSSLTELYWRSIANDTFPSQNNWFLSQKKLELKSYIFLKIQLGFSSKIKVPSSTRLGSGNFSSNSSLINYMLIYEIFISFCEYIDSKVKLCLSANKWKYFQAVFWWKSLVVFLLKKYLQEGKCFDSFEMLENWLFVQLLTDS